MTGTDPATTEQIDGISSHAGKAAGRLHFRCRGRHGPRQRSAGSGPGPRPSAELGVISLVEVVVCLALLSLLGAVIVPLVGTFASAGASIQSTYNTVDELIQPSQILDRYLHEAVAAAPESASTTPWWATFTAASGPDEVQFTADVGAYGQPSNSGHFTVWGPALVTVAVQSGPGRQPELVATLIPAAAGDCTGPGGGSGCQWTASPHLLFTVPDLTGVCLPGPTCNPLTSPVFEYLSSSDTTSPDPPATCTFSSGTENCPLNQVEAVQFTIQSQKTPGLPGGSQSQAYLLAPSYDAGLG